MRGEYRVELVSSAERELDALRNPMLRRVVVALLLLQGNPRPRGCTKLVGGDPKYRLRVGDYRIVYEVDDAERLVTVHRIRHRREVYD